MKQVVIYLNMGMGDAVIQNGLIREYAKTYDKVITFCYPHYEKSVRHMLSDLSAVKIIVVDTPGDMREWQVPPGAKILDLAQSFMRIPGLPYERFDASFYRKAEVPFEKKWDSFFVPPVSNSTTPMAPYSFVHDDERYPMTKLNAAYQPIRPDPTSENFFSYRDTVEKAAEIHVIDSSFMFLVDCLPYYNSDQKLFVHRYARFNQEYMYPTLKKNWTILE